MAVWPNGSLFWLSPVKTWGRVSHFGRYAHSGERFDRFTNANHARTASTPDGYDVRGMVPPVKAGSLSSWQPASIGVAASASMVNGTTLAGTSAITFVASDRYLSLRLKLDGSAALEFAAGNAVLFASQGLAGSWTVAVVGDTSSLSILLPFAGLGAFSLDGVADLRGRSSLVGEWTPFTELSPANLAKAVWAAELPGIYSEEQAGAIIAEIRRQSGLIPGLF